MCARAMLNKEKAVQMSDFIPNCFITVSKIMLLRNVWRGGCQSCLKRMFNHFFETEGNSYYATTGNKILYGIPTWWHNQT